MHGHLARASGTGILPGPGWPRITCMCRARTQVAGSWKEITEQGALSGIFMMKHVAAADVSA